MNIFFRSNLDCVHKYINNLKTDRHLPRVGERVEICFDGRKSFELEVVSVRHVMYANHPGTISEISIELHIPKWRNCSIAEWEQWFRKHVEEGSVNEKL